MRVKGNMPHDLALHERRVVVRKVGNSATMTLPWEALALLKWDVGDELAVSVLDEQQGEGKQLRVRRLR